MPTADTSYGSPYWWDDAGAPRATDDDLQSRCDLLIIGAGYTGLSGALAAHDADVSVQVIDGDIPGVGASSRNGGMFGAHPRFSVAIMEKRFGRAVAAGIYAEASIAEQFVRDLIAREKIDCELQDVGRIQLAWTKKHFAQQQHLVQSVARLSDMQLELVTRESLDEEIHTEQYYGGIRFPRHAGLHPLKYHRGLCKAVRQRGVPVLSHCEAQGIRQRADSGFDVDTSKGRVRAEKIMVATNGYTSSGDAAPLRWLQQRVFPLPSFLIATEAISRNRLQALAPGGRMMVETRARHSYYRLSPDGTRILFGGRASMIPTEPEQAARRLRKTMLEVWPSLDDVEISHSWSGNTGYAFGHMPQVVSHEGINFVAGFSGSGTVMAPYLGAKCAYQAIGDSRGETAYSDTALKRSWLHPVQKPHFLKAANHWYRQVVDRHESRLGRVQKNARLRH